ncbi:ABC transporter permease [candidate division KSB1 bacterium]|nr:ABC transporter permease [candidate division KSB1 bacterium]
MFKNNLKITLSILKRKKIYSFITIFGIAVPLMFLMIIISTASHIAAFKSPQSRFDRVLVFELIKFSLQRDYGMSGTMYVRPTYDFIDKYIKPMKTPDKIGMVTAGDYYNLYINEQKTKLKGVYTDDVFWEIADFNFIEGKPFNKIHIDNSQLVAVIDRYTKDLIFGSQNAVGKTVKFFRNQYKIIGVVENVDISRQRTHANFYLPITTSLEYTKKDIFGSGCICLMLAGSKSQFSQIISEFRHLITNFELGSYDGLTKIDGDLESDSFNKLLQGLFENLFSIRLKQEGVIHAAYIVIFFFFILLPAINLLYIHISRINERSSEIGVRKSFGGNNLTLSKQFIFENMTITVFSGILGLVLTFLFFWVFNKSSVIPGLHIVMNTKSILLILALWIFFGVVTGFLPAYRMSRMKIIDALNQHDSFHYFNFLIWKAKRLKMLLIVEFTITFIALAAICTFMYHFKNNNGYPLGFDFENIYQVSVSQYDNEGSGFFGGGGYNEDVFEWVKLNSLVEIYGEWSWNEPYHEGYTQVNGKVTYGDQVLEKVHLTQTGPNMDKIFKLNLIAGSWFMESDDRPDYNPLIINKTVKQKLFKDKKAIGETIQFCENYFTVIGVVDSYKYHGEFSRPVDIMFYMNGFNNLNINSWSRARTDYFRARHGTTLGDINNMARSVSLAFPDYGIEITPLAAERAKYFRKIWIPIVMVAIVFSFILLIVLFGLFGVLWYNISLRKMEIGLRRAVGADTGKIFTQIVLEMLVWASIGMIIGLFIFAQVPLLKLISLDIQNFTSSVLTAGLVIYLLVGFCSLIPGLQAAKIKPALALHEE